MNAFVPTHCATLRSIASSCLMLSLYCAARRVDPRPTAAGLIHGVGALHHWHAGVRS